MKKKRTRKKFYRTYKTTKLPAIPNDQKSPSKVHSKTVPYNLLPPKPQVLSFFGTDSSRTPFESLSKEPDVYKLSSSLGQPPSLYPKNQKEGKLE